MVRNEGGVLPLKAEEPLRILHLVMSSDARIDASVIQGIPEAELAARRIPTETMWLGPEVSEATAERILERAAGLHARAGVGVRAGRSLPRQRGHVARRTRALLEAAASPPAAR